MIKLSGSLLVSVFSFFYYWWIILLNDGVVATLNIPDNIKPGETVIAEVIINKGNTGGFAKLQIEVGNGLTIAEEDNKGSAFSFSGNTAKWIWTALPMEAEFKVKFKVTASPSATGQTTISGKFSYIVNNAKKVTEIPSKTIAITDKPSEQVAQQNPAPDTTPTSPTNTVTITTSTNVNVAVETSTPQANVDNTGQTSSSSVTPVSLNRTIENINSSSWKITVQIHKSNIKGFARYEDILPPGLTARAEEKDGSSFFVDNNTIKFVWSSLPEKETIVIAYILSGNLQDPVTLKGNFSYTEDNQMRTQSVDPETIQPSMNAANTNSSQQPTPQQVPTTNVAETTTKARQVGVFFSVQLGAFQKSRVTETYFRKKYNISDIIQEYHETYKKFYSGNYTEYKQARDYREEIKLKGIQDAFVIAHNNSTRITVQEALMITNQKWYP